MFESYDVFETDRETKCAILIAKLKASKSSDKDLIGKLESSLANDDVTLMRVMWHNLREHQLSACHYNDLCLRMLNMQGYDVTMIKEGERDADRKNDRVDADVEADYNKITFISRDGIEKLNKQKFVSPEDNLRKERYYFENMTVRGLDDATKADIFFNHYLVSHKKKYLEHVRYEKTKNLSAEDVIERDLHHSDKLVNKMQMVSLKRSHIRNMNKLMGLEHSCVDGFVIDKSIMTGKVLNYIREHIDNLTTVFNSKVTMNNTNSDNFGALKLTQKIYGGWSGLKINKHKSARNGTADSYITACDDLYESIDGFQTYTTTPAEVIALLEKVD